MHNVNCVHSCKGLCNALSLAEFREAESIKEYTRFLEECDYPEVREILGELIRDRERALLSLRAKRTALQVKFDTLDNINDSFA
jgi:rubrerythrin